MVKLIASIFRQPLADTLKYIKRIETDDRGTKTFLVGEDAVINVKKVEFENSTIYIVKSREFYDGVQRPFLIFRSKKFAIVAVKYNQVVVEIMPDGGGPNLFFALAFTSQSGAGFFFEQAKHDSIKNHLRSNIMDKFRALL